MKRRAWKLGFAVSFIALGALVRFVQAQPFPVGPISLVIPLAPGDAGDIAARAMGEALSRLLKTPVLAVNRPGAGGAVGTNGVVQARKDGHTILFTPNSALTFRAVLDPQSVTYDALRDLTPLGTASRTPSMLVVRADGPFKNFAAFMDYAKKMPGQIRTAHPGAGSVGEFSLQLISALTGVALLPVPYSGAAPAVVALRGGHVDAVVLSIGALSTHIRSGVFRGIVTSSRSAEFADIQTLRELGYREDLFGIWFSFFAPVGIPDDARKALISAIEQAVESPAITAKLAPLGIAQSYGSPEKTAAEIREEFKRVSEMARKTGLVK